MKYILSILLLILISCKNESKPKNASSDSVSLMWDSFIKSHHDAQNEEIPESWFFHNNREDANRLGKLVLAGKKKAASGLYAWYEEANADLPKVGKKHIITDFDGKAIAIIKINKVDTIPFNRISKEYAEMDMGTTNKALNKWKKAHWDFFSSTIKESSTKPTENMLVVCEQFERIWPKN